ncbi:Cd(II)/Pb(II)-responsive transcriptional regulator [Testudinibacter aquarius]|uniref:Cd(II)/Pb(II)-responsive transcriptional regulator n=1 Tax=Testudinibacter aquarius TaxID=1524974 RepID=A0A4R3Y3X0_9PAST|nr:Cd(II)/Pb(II)-responsive transcriptional regulator [Testudinibacter aquarius]KAE9528275.1 Cd(II)/Pb(II)-responsive transcriptional regulator [Testudinibacter aquarius]TCV84813.1 Cd(II)/Pb(II)-responsive transcriptional regulator [Testudinibacter aquarius]TNG92343.1 Cd(II)/Pb(II)-responsive transcriptional regulator [Testudinibacter aquarius]
MKIGDLAKQTGCPVETIRYYEREGLMPQAQRNLMNNYREYGTVHLERLVFIRRCRTLEMTQDEIRELLQAKADPNASCASINDLIDAHLSHVKARIAELQALKKQLGELRSQCGEIHRTQDCGILKGLERPNERDIAHSVSHIGKVCGRQ